ncbi:MAG: hypothetical protein KBS95_02445 [Alistipes sp.]|nr:hypothetical protein [Candidatus Alistipes equi]
MKKLFVLAVAMMLAFCASAQSTSGEIVTKYNDAINAIQAKDWAKALPLLEDVVAKGIDSEDNNVLNCVTNAKKFIPTCYRQMGTAAASKKDFETATKNLNKAAEKAELFGDKPGLAKIKMILSKVYKVQGGEAFNAKDYVTAAQVFAKGYEANKRDTEMALNLAMSYCESGEFLKGLEVYNAICAMQPDKYAEAIAKANEMKELYTNNEFAKLQQANNWDGVIDTANGILALEPTSAAAEKFRLQAYNAKKDYDKVIELAPSALAAQTSEELKSDVYFLLGAAYNAKEMKADAIKALSQVTAGASKEAAAKALAELKK